jgi:hypothetical protein
MSTQHGRGTVGTGVKVFQADAASQGFWPGDHIDCVDGELCWILPPCGNDDRGCDCWSEFEGASTGGRTTTARVGVLEDSTRSEVLRVLRTAATPLIGPVLAQRAAEATLAAASQFKPGTFVLRDLRGVRSQFCEHHQEQFGSGVRWDPADGTGR